MFDQEEFAQDGSSSLFSSVVGFLIRAFLAVTTAGFFYMFGGDIWSWILPYPMASFAAALTGVLLVDGLAFSWTSLRRNSADTIEQQHYAKAGSWLDMALSLCITAVFIILTTPLLQSSVSTEIYEVMTNFASWLGIIVGVVSFSGNGLLWHFYDNASADSVKRLQVNQLRALAMKAEHALEMSRMRQHAKKAAANIAAVLPSYTEKAAQKSMSDYLSTRFADSPVSELPSGGDGDESDGDPREIGFFRFDQQEATTPPPRTTNSERTAVSRMRKGLGSDGNFT